MVIDTRPEVRESYDKRYSVVTIGETAHLAKPSEYYYALCGQWLYERQQFVYDDRLVFDGAAVCYRCLKRYAAVKRQTIAGP